MPSAKCPEIILFALCLAACHAPDAVLVTRDANAADGGQEAVRSAAWPGAQNVRNQNVQNQNVRNQNSQNVQNEQKEGPKVTRSSGWDEDDGGRGRGRGSGGRGKSVSYQHELAGLATNNGEKGIALVRDLVEHSGMGVDEPTPSTGARLRRFMCSSRLART